MRQSRKYMMSPADHLHYDLCSGRRLLSYSLVCIPLLPSSLAELGVLESPFTWLEIQLLAKDLVFSLAILLSIPTSVALVWFRGMGLGIQPSPPV
uniref:Uncharacterized protein n=1 Tax=Picea glauca TaxID=3330 RepID=A0A101M4D1_PICGL|nr:hypothetical protein ABT39_MTgene692 [Picea glauca]